MLGVLVMSSDKKKTTAVSGGKSSKDIWGREDLTLRFLLELFYRENVSPQARLL